VSLLNTLHSKERWWAIKAALITVAITYVPYLVGWYRQTSEFRFTGILFNSIDANVYLAIMQQGWRGAWLMTLPYSAEAHSPIFLYEFYIVLGQISRVLGLPPIVGYHLARGLGGLWMLWAAYDYLSVHLAWRAAWKIAYLLVCTGSGFGWLTQVVMPAGPDGISGIDLWLMDAFAFFSLLLVPHFTVAWALMLTLLTSIHHSAFSPKPKLLLIAFSAGLGLTLVHPKIVPAAGVISFVSAALLSWKRRERAVAIFGVLSAAGIGVAPVALYYAFALRADPAFAMLARQDITMSPPFQYYTLGFGVSSLLACSGVVCVLRRRRLPELSLVAWLITGAVMLYVPVQIQRRFIMGLQVPLAGLAGIGLAAVVLPALKHSRFSRWLARRYHPRRFRLLTINLILALAAISNILLATGYTFSAWLRSPAMFVPSGVAQAADWLGRESHVGDLTLAAYETGNYISARSGARTCIGHWNLTLDFYVKQDIVFQIFDVDTTNARREEFVRSLGCRFLFYGPAERQLGAFDPATAPYLKLAFAASAVEIYELRPQR
jgi:hypothetical protein